MFILKYKGPCDKTSVKKGCHFTELVGYLYTHVVVHKWHHIILWFLTKLVSFSLKVFRTITDVLSNCLQDAFYGWTSTRYSVLRKLHFLSCDSRGNASKIVCRHDDSSGVHFTKSFFATLPKRLDSLTNKNN